MGDSGTAVLPGICESGTPLKYTTSRVSIQPVSTSAGKSTTGIKNLFNNFFKSIYKGFSLTSNASFYSNGRNLVKAFGFVRTWLERKAFERMEGLRVAEGFITSMYTQVIVFLLKAYIFLPTF